MAFLARYRIEVVHKGSRSLILADELLEDNSALCLVGKVSDTALDKQWDRFVLIAEVVKLEGLHIWQVKAPQDLSIGARVKAEHFADKSGGDDYFVQTELVAGELFKSDRATA